MKTSGFFFLVFLIIIILGCNKTATFERRINNLWECEIVEIEEGSGFIYHDSLDQFNIITFNQENINCNLNFEFQPLGVSFLIYDSLHLNASFEILNESLIVGNHDIVFKIKHLSNSNLVISYYDESNYRLKTFYCKKH